MEELFFSFINIKTFICHFLTKLKRNQNLIFWKNSVLGIACVTAAVSLSAFFFLPFPKSWFLNVKIHPPWGTSPSSEGPVRITLRCKHCFLIPCRGGFQRQGMMLGCQVERWVLSGGNLGCPMKIKLEIRLEIRFLLPAAHDCGARCWRSDKIQVPPPWDPVVYLIICQCYTRL